MAKGSAKKPKESKCRGSSAPLEGRDWVRVGGSKWLREVAEKQGKFVAVEYREKNGQQFEQERAARAEEAEKAFYTIVRDEPRAASVNDEDAPIDEEEATYAGNTYAGAAASE